MSSNQAREWDDQYAKLARISSQLNSHGLDPSSRGKQLLSLRDGLEDLNRKLVGMEEASSHANSFGSNVNKRSFLTPAECSRRRLLMDGLGKKYDNLMSGNSNSNVKTYSTFGSDNGSIGSGNNSNMGVSKRTSALSQQDAMLDELAAGVGKLKDTTRVVGAEAKYHVNLLNDMERDMEIAQGGLADETNNALKLKESQSVWRLYLYILGLSLLMLLLILCGIS